MSAVVKALSEGESAPDFALPSDQGGQAKLSDFRGKRVVLYFYSKDNTSGWTKEAQAFQERIAEFQEKGAVIIGISPDSLTSHQKFRQKYGLNFLLLSDPDHAVATLYGVYKEKTMYGKKRMGIERSTFIIDEDGVISKVFRRVQVKGHAEDVLGFL